MNASGYQAYKNQSIFTMTQGELLLTLYDELVKRLLQADLALRNQDYGIFEHSIGRSAEIVDYLNSTLDNRYQISVQLSRMYYFFKFYLARIEAGRDDEKIIELIELVKELRTAFYEANKKAGI